MSTPNPLVTRSNEVMSGVVVFAETRVPAQTLLDYLEAGDSIADFLKGFPTVSRKQVVAVLEEMKEQLLVPAHAQDPSRRVRGLAVVTAPAPPPRYHSGESRLVGREERTTASASRG